MSDWVGHKKIATTSIYANTTLSHLSDARAIFERSTGAGDWRTAGTSEFRGPSGGCGRPNRRVLLKVSPDGPVSSRG